MARPRRKDRQGENQRPPDPEPKPQEEESKGTVRTTMATSRIAFKDMTDAQKAVAFQKFSEKQDTNKGRNVAKRKALNDLKAAHVDEYDASVKKYAAAEGVTMPVAGASSDDSE